jgi:hypothetical protein
MVDGGTHHLKTDENASLSTIVSVPTQTTPTYNPQSQNKEAIPIETPAESTESSSLGALEILPVELIFRILDFMDPRQYSGLPCTCQRALLIVNRKLEFEEACYTTLSFWKSATAPYVNRITLAPLECGWENVCICYGPDPNESDSDL